MAKKVLVGMSGGVDSAACVLLLQKQGYDVSGVTLRLHHYKDRPGTCGSADDIEEAARVAAQMGISHRVLDLCDIFRREVMGHFVSEYCAGRTPNPCLDCNRELKFGAMLDWALDHGFDYVSTGHYARVGFDAASGRHLLLRGVDAHKDQSYVLYQMTQRQLAHLLLPVGEYSKPEIRALAADFGLENAQKPDSQDICFVPDGDYAGFIEGWCRTRCCEGEAPCVPLAVAAEGGPRSAPTGSGSVAASVATAFEPGEIVNREGRVLGEHAGLIRYTIGQRKGIGVAAREPLYVLGKDASANRLVVGFKDELLSSGVVACDVNLISGGVLEGPRKVQVKTHYRQRPVLATAEQTGPDELTVTFEEPQRAAAPGQAAVLYEGDVVLGGGTIARTF